MKLSIFINDVILVGELMSSPISGNSIDNYVLVNGVPVRGMDKYEFVTMGDIFKLNTELMEMYKTWFDSL
jgi:hypothetical protein